MALFNASSPLPLPASGVQAFGFLRLCDRGHTFGIGGLEFGV